MTGQTDKPRNLFHMILGASSDPEKLNNIKEQVGGLFLVEVMIQMC